MAARTRGKLKSRSRLSSSPVPTDRLMLRPFTHVRCRLCTRAPAHPLLPARQLARAQHDDSAV